MLHLLLRKSFPQCEQASAKQDVETGAKFCVFCWLFEHIRMRKPLAPICSWQRHPQTSVLFSCVKYVRIHLPHVCIFENVIGFGMATGSSEAASSPLDVLLGELSQLQYHCVVDRLDLNMFHEAARPRQFLDLSLSV